MEACSDVRLRCRGDLRLRPPDAVVVWVLSPEAELLTRFSNSSVSDIRTPFRPSLVPGFCEVATVCVAFATGVVRLMPVFRGGVLLPGVVPGVGEVVEVVAVGVADCEGVTAELLAPSGGALANGCGLCAPAVPLIVPPRVPLPPLAEA